MRPLFAPWHLPWLLFRALRRTGGHVGRDRCPDQELEGALVDLLALMDVDRPSHVPVEARVEELGRVLQGSPLGERELHGGLVRLAGADDAVVRPDRHAPLPLLDDVGVRRLDELAHPAEDFAAPIRELGDSPRDKLSRRFALARARLFHALILKLLGQRSIERNETYDQEYGQARCRPREAMRVTPPLARNMA